MEFRHRRHVYKAEKSWKLIASSLQCILGCNVELRITHVPRTSDSKCAKLKRSSFSIFSCSRRTQQKRLSSNEQKSESDYADYTKSCHGTDVVTTLRSSEGNLLRSGERVLNRPCQETVGISCSGVDSSKEEGCNCAHLVPTILDSDNQSNCFPQTLWLQKKFRSSNSSKLSFQGIQQQKDFVLPMPSCTSSETYTYANEPGIFSSSSRNCTEAIGKK